MMTRSTASPTPRYRLPPRYPVTVLGDASTTVSEIRIPGAARWPRGGGEDGGGVERQLERFNKTPALTRNACRPW